MPDSATASNPLVTVRVLSYNSAKYIIETLDSIKEQSYKNIELVISDDCSTDNTVEICEEWTVKNKYRFVRCEIITSPVNTGITANLNRALSACKGEWVKGVGADDLLKQNCITDLVEAAKKTGAKILFSRIEHIDQNSERTGRTLPYGKQEVFFSYPPQKQFNYLLTKSFNMAPSKFINRNLLLDLNGYDETYPMLDDLPMWLKITKSGIKLHFLNKVTVGYRVHEESISRSRELFYNSYHEDLRRFHKKEIYPYVKWNKVIFWQSQFIDNLKYVLITTFLDNSVNRKSILLSDVLDSLKLNFLFAKAKGSILNLCKKIFYAK